MRLDQLTKSAKKTWNESIERAYKTALGRDITEEDTDRMDIVQKQDPLREELYLDGRLLGTLSFHHNQLQDKLVVKYDSAN